MIAPTKRPDVANPPNTRLNDANIDTQANVKNDGVPRQPNDRDESPDAQLTAPREIMEQAAQDLAEGQVDTDMRGMRGAETVTPASAATSNSAKVAKGSTQLDRAGTPLTPVEKTRGTH
ncbi:MAG TPA: hypothetical protein VIT92_12525 [Burkholderiaceae bacterium]